MESEIIRTAIKVGNSAGVLLPKQYLNSQVKVVLQPLNIERDILEILLEENLLKNTLGIYLVGSYARKEQKIESDIDVLVITSSISKKIIRERYEIILLTKEQVEKQLKTNIVPLLPMLKEAKPIINGTLLEKYKQTKLTKKNLKWHIETTKSAMKVIEKSISLAKELGIKEGDSSAYSLILRLRGVHIVNCLKKDKLWSKKEFLNLIKEIAGSLKAYEGYSRAKADKKTKEGLPIEEAEKLMEYINKKIKEQE